MCMETSQNKLMLRNHNYYYWLLLFELIDHSLSFLAMRNTLLSLKLDHSMVSVFFLPIFHELSRVLPSSRIQGFFGHSLNFSVWPDEAFDIGLWCLGSCRSMYVDGYRNTSIRRTSYYLASEIFIERAKREVAF